MAEEQLQQINVAYPPDFVFKYPRNRYVPAQEVITEQTIFNFERMKYPPLKDEPEEFFNKYGFKKEQFDWNFSPEEEKMGGQLAYFTGTKYPSKGHPFPQALYAVGMAKKETRALLEFLSKKDLLLVFLGFLITPSKWKGSIVDRAIKVYTETCGRIMMPYILGDRFLTSCSQELLRFSHNFFKKVGINENVHMDFDINFSDIAVAQVEYDNVYRLRVEDAMSETTKEKMLNDPRGELKKIAKILSERDPDYHTSEKFERIIKMARMLLLIPKYKRIFKECIEESNFENFQYDKADSYHSLLIQDYPFGGKSIDDRVKEYMEIHGVDINGKPTREGGAFPPRITYKSQQK